MAFCFYGSLLRANFNMVFSCLILLLFVANKFLLLLPLLCYCIGSLDLVKLKILLYAGTIVLDVSSVSKGMNQ